MDDSLKILKDDLQKLHEQENKIINDCVEHLNQKYECLRDRQVTFTLDGASYDGFFGGFQKHATFPFETIKPVIYGYNNDGTRSKRAITIRMMPFEPFSLELKGE